MLLELHAKRDQLAETSVTAKSGSTTYHRLKAGEQEFQFEHVTVGFLLNRSPRHEGAFGQDKFVPMPMDAGEGWVLPAGLPGKARWYQELDFMNVHISASALSRINDGKLPQYEARSQVRDPTFVQLAVNLHEIAEADETILKMYRDTMMFALAAHVNHVWGGVRRELLTQRVDSRIRRAIDYIEAHLETDISLEKLASVAAMSPYHFSRIFKSATGLPPHRFLASRRINRAKPLLKTTNLPIVEIAYRVGYADVSHFTQLFKRITGGTPGNFRNAA